MKNIGIIVLFFVISSCQAQQEAGSISATAFHETISKTQQATVLDVRTAEEFTQGYLQGAINIDYRSNQFEQQLATLDKSKPYFVYCLSGGRSASAAKLMRDKGFTKVYDMKGGILAWQKAKLPLETKNASATEDKISSAAYAEMISKDSVVLIDFYAPWCAPCKEMEPMLEALTKEYAGRVTIIRLNIDENKQLAREQAVDEIPLFRLYRQGKQVWSHFGQLDKAAIIQQF